jgi:YesN/AraC family two-component response regulator
MPGMSGVELSREVAVRHPTVRTVLLTAYGDDTLARNALAAHAVTVLAKPLRMVDLERVLDETGTL